MIWEYDASSSDVDATRVGLKALTCLFCGVPLQSIHDERAVHREDNGTSRRLFRIRACPACGWWVSKVTMSSFYRETAVRETVGAMATLRQFDSSGLQEPIEAVRTYLIAKYEDRFHLHPRIFEEVVASVFGSLGFQVRATAYSKDGGIDVVLDGSGELPICVQVKRSSNAIQVGLIREFTGALVAEGCTRGLFVTTSRFTRGAEAAADLYRVRGYAIELFNSERFYGALRLAQRPMYDRLLGDEPFTVARHHHMHRRSRILDRGAA